jgi:hypothetical protein
VRMIRNCASDFGKNTACITIFELPIV